MQTTTKDVDKYLNSLPDEVQGDVKILDTLIADVMTGHSRKLWEGVFWGGSEQVIIGYGDTTYTRSDKQIVKWFAVGLALQKNYISVYISAYPVKSHASKLGKVKTGASSISFKKLADINLDELQKLVKIAKIQAT